MNNFREGLNKVVGEKESIKLSEILEFKNGFNNVKSLNESNTKFINVLDVLSNTNIYNKKIKDSIYISVDDMQKFSIIKNDILFLRSSETREEVGLANVYMDEVESTFGGFVIRGRIIGNYKINSIYLKNYLNTKGRNQIFKKAGGSTRFNVGQDTLNEVIVELPEVEIQDRVINFLSSIDILIEKQEEYIKQLEVRKQVILRQVFNAENEDQMIKLLNVGNIVTGKTPSTKNKDFWNGTIPFITPTDMKNTKYILTERYVSIDFLNASYILPKESVCFTSIASIGKMCKTQEASITNQQINSIICNEHYNSDYVYYNLRYLVPKIKSTVISDGIAMINKTEFSTIKIKNVILEEQNKIASLLSSMDKLMN